MKKLRVLCVVFGAIFAIFGPLSLLWGAGSYEDLVELGQKDFLQIVPDASNSSLDRDKGKIPCSITNVYTQNIRIYPDAISLMTLNDSGQMVTLAKFSTGFDDVDFSGPDNSPNDSNVIELKPGESATLSGVADLEFLKAAADKPKQVYARAHAGLSGTHPIQFFHSFSAGFSVPVLLTGSSWTDLGEQGKFSVVPHLDQARLGGGSIGELRLSDTNYAQRIQNGWSDYLLIPAATVNNTSQSYVIDDQSVAYFIAKDGVNRQIPPPWDLLKRTTPILEASGTATGICRMKIQIMNQQGYKPGDQIVLVARGRAPNSTQVFENHSAPFTLPALPSGSAEGSGSSDSQSPLPPSNLTASSGDGRVALSWGGDQGINCYSIYRGLQPGGEDTPIATGIVGKSFADTAVTNGTRYYYKVKAVNDSGASDFSNEASATAGIPSVPTGLAATPGDSQVSLQWDASPGADSYNVYRGTTAGGEDRANPVATALSSPSFTDNGLANGTTYYYIVKAANQIGTSDFSQEVSATPLQVPSNPTQLVASAGVQEVNLTWSASDRATSYNIYRGLSAGGEDLGQPIASATTSSYKDTQVQNGATYYYVVNAVNQAGSSGLSNEVSAVPL